MIQGQSRPSIRGLAMVAAIMLALTACAPAPSETEREDRLLAALLPPESLGRTLSLSQVVEGAFGDEKHSLRVEIELTPTRLVMVGLSHAGLPVFSLAQEAGTIQMEVLAADQPPLEPRYILSDFQIAHWPGGTLANQLGSLGLRLDDNPEAGTRTIFGGDGEALLEVTYGAPAFAVGDIFVNHLRRGYRLHIKTFETRDQ